MKYGTAHLLSCRSLAFLPLADWGAKTRYKPGVSAVPKMVLHHHICISTLCAVTGTQGEDGSNEVHANAARNVLAIGPPLRGNEG